MPRWEKQAAVCRGDIARRALAWFQCPGFICSSSGSTLRPTPIVVCMALITGCPSGDCVRLKDSQISPVWVTLPGQDVVSRTR